MTDVQKIFSSLNDDEMMNGIDNVFYDDKLLMV